MRIGLISDTHVPQAASSMPPAVAEVFRGVDLILHAGDIYRLSVLDELERIAPVKAALGDDDPADLLEDDRVEMKHELDLEGHRVWLVHGRPWVYSMTALQKEHAPDIIVHGHTHDTEIREREGVLYVGSGSPTFLMYSRGPGTVGILEIKPGGVEASIVHLNGNIV